MAHCATGTAVLGGTPWGTTSRLTSGETGVRQEKHGQIKMSSTSKIFAQIVNHRRSVGRFDPQRLVPSPLVRELVDLTLRAPSGFNMQPYVVVLVDDPLVRGKVSEGMLGGGNAARVREAPLVALFCADLEALLSVGEVQEMEAGAQQKSASYVRSLPTSVAAFAGVTSGGSSSGGGCAGGGEAKNAGRMALVGAVQAFSAFTGVPMPPVAASGMAWAYKQTALAAMTYMLAATSLGLDTHPMEGHDPERVAEAVGLSSTRYSPALVVATGFEVEGGGAQGKPPSPRRTNVFRLNSASIPFPNTV